MHSPGSSRVSKCHSRIRNQCSTRLFSVSNLDWMIVTGTQQCQIHAYTIQIYACEISFDLWNLQHCIVAYKLKSDMINVMQLK